MKRILLIIGICVLAFFACKKDIALLHETKPMISTVECTDITDSSAILHCKITNKGGVSQPSYGFYYSDEHSPTYADKKIRIIDGSYEYILIGLKESTTYYVRAFAKNKYGEVLGDLVKFTTLPKYLPTLGTTSVSNVTASSAILTSSVVSEGASPIIARGFCISTKSTPTVADGCITVGSGIGLFSYMLQDLEDGVKFYVRAYATSSVGVTYGEKISFTTNIQSVEIVDGAIQAKFSVSDTKKIYFSQGNLQYQASTNTWRFAENQYDMIGDDNSNISTSYNGWIDLFGWGTSGWNSGANAYQPYSTSTSNGDYYPGGDYKNNLTGNYANADWGVYNAISNGGNQAGLWRTLTKYEWIYMLSKRSNAASKLGKAIVNGITGIILLPDRWTLPKGLTFTSGAFAENTYTAPEWSKMEANGAVFLPAAGYRSGTTVSSGGVTCVYWSSSHEDSLAYRRYYGRYSSGYGGVNRWLGYSVRVVQDVNISIW